MITQSSEEDGKVNLQIVLYTERRPTSGQCPIQCSYNKSSTATNIWRMITRQPKTVIYNTKIKRQP